MLKLRLCSVSILLIEADDKLQFSLQYRYAEDENLLSLLFQPKKPVTRLLYMKKDATFGRICKSITNMKVAKGILSRYRGEIKHSLCMF